jgi:hypothetical protein
LEWQKTLTNLETFMLIARLILSAGLLAFGAPQSLAAGPTIGENVIIKKSSWKLGGFGNVMVISLTIENKNPIALKDFIVECTTAGASGTDLSTVRQQVFEILPAKKTKSFNGINMGIVDSQSRRAGCSIIGGMPA